MGHRLQPVELYDRYVGAAAALSRPLGRAVARVGKQRDGTSPSPTITPHEPPLPDRAAAWGRQLK